MIQYSAGARQLYLLENVLAGTEANPSTVSMGNGTLFARVKRPLTSVSVKNEWSYTSTPYIYFYNNYRDKFVFTFTDEPFFIFLLMFSKAI